MLVLVGVQMIGSLDSLKTAREYHTAFALPYCLTVYVNDFFAVPFQWYQDLAVACVVSLDQY